MKYAIQPILGEIDAILKPFGDLTEDEFIFDVAGLVHVKLLRLVYKLYKANKQKGE